VRVVKEEKPKGSILSVKEAEREREYPSSKHTQRGDPFTLTHCKIRVWIVV